MHTLYNALCKTRALKSLNNPGGNYPIDVYFNIGGVQFVKSHKYYY